MQRTHSKSAWMAITVLGITATLHAQTTAPVPTDEKIDTLLVRQQQLLEGQESLKRELLPQDLFPNGAKSVTFNLPLALMGSANGSTVLSASASWFPPHSQLEIVLPLYLRDDHDDDQFRGLLADLQGRLYLNPRRSGIYVVGGLRSAWLSGEEDGEWLWDEQSGIGYYSSGPLRRLHKLGFYGGAGWRASSTRFYWNTNLVMGRYVGDTAPELDGDGMMGGKLLLDMEFFKFGFIF